ncbi:MAG TPA: LCP family protein [Acidimicrobiia bacterium]|nr:LCP family protein [Acidimicrobiia bacterium]
MSGSALSRWFARYFLALGLAVVVTAVGLAGGYWYLSAKWANAEDIDLSTDEGSANFLVVGSDSRVDTTGNPIDEGLGSVGGQRADTIMIVRVDPKTRDAMLVSFPRDLWVEIPGQGSAKINSAFNGGPQLLIDTLRHNFDVPIHHYVQVDFAGFRNIVDAMGGVEMYVASPSRDAQSALLIPTAGCVTLDGNQALSWVRSRHFQYYESGTWRTDPTGDFGRINRQQEFIRRLMAQAIESGASNPVRGNRVINKALENVRVDDGLGVTSVLRLAGAFRSTDPEKVDMISIPATVGRAGGQSVVFVKDDEAAPIFERLRGEGGDDGEITPSAVRFRVLNGVGSAGLATRTARQLQAVGFEPGSSTAGDAPTYGYETTELRYRPGMEAAAELVREYLDGVGELIEDAAVGDVDVLVIVGADYRGVSEPEGDEVSLGAVGLVSEVQPQTPSTPPPAGTDAQPAC